MAVSSNKLVPLAGGVVLVIVASILVMSLRGGNQSAKPMDAVPLPKTAGADQDTPTETLKTVVESNRLLREDVQKVIAENKELRKQLGGSSGSVAALGQGQLPAAAGQGADGSPIDVLSNAWGTASDTLSSLSTSRSGAATAAANETTDANGPILPPDSGAGAVGYKVLPPMGYTAQISTQGVTPTTRYVRTAPTASASGAGASSGPASRAAQAAATAKPESVPYFTIPENATLAGVTAMTSLIGRVPINGRVTDPMQFKAIVGRDNLATNGWELPDDLAGMIVTGVAIGDMALSCSEGKVRSLTFVFNDGAIRTVSARRAGNGAGSSAGGSGDIGFISDLYGNPCIQGKFVTNAPAYLTDIIGAKSLGIAAEALAQAQTTVSTGTDSTTTSVSGNAAQYALGKAGSGAADELIQWLTDRLKNSFDAVVTPSGQRLVVHLDQEIQIDKPATPRKIVHRTQASNTLSGARYGLE